MSNNLESSASLFIILYMFKSILEQTKINVMYVIMDQVAFHMLFTSGKKFKQK